MFSEVWTDGCEVAEEVAREQPKQNDVRLGKPGSKGQSRGIAGRLRGASKDQGGLGV